MRNKGKNLLAFILMLSILVSNFALATELREMKVDRIAGTNRIETSVAASKEMYRNGSDTVVIAGFNGEVDALTGTILASHEDAPLLVTRKDSIAKELQKELERLDPKKVIILGGESVVSRNVENKLIKSYEVERLAGKNRQDTARLIAEKINVKTNHAFLALGFNELADALAIGPVSASNGIPIYLTKKDDLTEVTKKALTNKGITNITIIGGENAVSKKVENQLKVLGIETNRIAGANRAETATIIADKYFKGSNKAIVAYGWKYADALIGGYIGAMNKSPILLTRTDRISAITLNYLRDKVEDTYILGGEAVVNLSVENEIRNVRVIEIEDLEVHFIDVGQGDSILIKEGNKTVLIDAGLKGQGNTVVQYLKENNVTKIDYLIGTHPHADHIGGFISVLDEFEIGDVIMPNKITTTKIFEDVLDKIAEKGLKITIPEVGDTITLKDAKFTVFSPIINEDNDPTINNASIVLKLEYKNNSFLFTGDAEVQPEVEIIERNHNLKSDVLKLGHHGSKTSTSEEFLNAVNPQYGIISCGENNQYGHPDKIVLDRLLQRNINVFRTDLNGNIKVISDGNAIKFEVENSRNISFNIIPTFKFAV